MAGTSHEAFAAEMVGRYQCGRAPGYQHNWPEKYLPGEVLEKLKASEGRDWVDDDGFTWGWSRICAYPDGRPILKVASKPLGQGCHEIKYVLPGGSEVMVGHEPPRAEGGPRGPAPAADAGLSAKGSRTLVSRSLPPELLARWQKMADELLAVPDYTGMKPWQRDEAMYDSAEKELCFAKSLLGFVLDSPTQSRALLEAVAEAFPDMVDRDVSQD